MTERPDDFTDKLKQAVQALRAPEPSDALLVRILEDRKKGHRIDLSTAPVPRRRAVFIGIATAAAAAAVVMWIAADTRHGSSEMQRSESSGFAELAAGMGLWPDRLYAQAVTTSQLPRIPALNGSQLRGGRWVYAVRTTYEDGRVLAERSDSVLISGGLFQNLPAWLVIKEWNYPAVSSTQIDTSWFSRDSLRPLARFSRLRAGPTLRTTFTGDSAVRVWRQGEMEMERVAVPLPTPRLWDGGAVLSPTQLWPLFLTTRLDPTWKGGYPGTGIANSHELVTFWFDLLVTGEERITVPAGTFDCWKISEFSGSYLIYQYWVDKASGWIIKEGNEPVSRVSRELVSYTPHE